MNKETNSSLLLTKLSMVILAIVFLTGIVEVACLVFYAHKNNYAVLNELKSTTTIQNSQKSSTVFTTPAADKI